MHNYYIFVLSIRHEMKKVGRPKEDDPKSNVPLRLRGSLVSKIKKIADKQDRSLSYMLEKAIEEKYA